MNIHGNLIELLRYIKRLGLASGASSFFKIKTGNTNNIRLKQFKHPFKLRKASSDIAVFHQVFINKEYNFNAGFNPGFIIDGGGNVGLAALYFANVYPDAKIVSVEPESDNYNMLVDNTRAYDNIYPIQSGLWNKSTYLKVKNIGLDDWGFVVEECDKEDAETFRALSIADIMTQYQADEIDILKLDIEGAEKEVFTNNYDRWLPKTKILIVELHDRMKAGCSSAFIKAMAQYNFTIHPLGENFICIRQ